MGLWDRITENKIQAAQDEGQFDNLRGAGKPIQWPEESSDPAWSLAHHLLRENGFSLPWIEDLRGIDAGVQTARTQLARAWEAHQAACLVDPARARAHWSRARADFERRAAELNRQITTFNLTVPLARFQRPPLNVEREIAKLTGI